MEIIVALITIIAGCFVASLLGLGLNWSNTGAVVAIMVWKTYFYESIKIY